MDHADQLEAGLVAGRYRLGELLGRGGMATVRRADDVRLGRPVAVKFLDPVLAARPDLRRRFEDEARSAARLSHPAVVCVYDTGEWDGVPFLVMELLSGRTLADELNDGALPLARVRRVAGDVLGALAAAHAVGVLHRDIKPANLLVTDDGSVKVADFGIAKADPTLGGGSSTDTVAGQVLGTPSYLSPERLSGYPATPASDVWSVGVVCWEALAGRRAFPSDTPMGTALAVMQTDLPPVAVIRPDADPQLALAIDVALRRDPAARWPSATDMRGALTSRNAPAAAATVPAALTAGATAGANARSAPEVAPTVAAFAGAAAPAPAAARPAPPTRIMAPAPVMAPRRTGMPPALFGVLATLLVAAIIAVAVLLASRAPAGSSSGSAGAAPSTVAPTTTAAPTTTSTPPTTARLTTTPTPPAGRHGGHKGDGGG